MERYRVFETANFRKRKKRLDGSEFQWFLKIVEELKIRPRGKPLVFSWFCEKKYHNKRLFFMIDENTKRVLILDFGTKKEQQKIIDFVLKNKNELFTYLRSKL
tara:strand:- start:1585 stop:1893 length:309 start_codon:yes stop_codon:yes gene_type:complete